jgi:O-antigen ligase
VLALALVATGVAVTRTEKHGGPAQGANPARLVSTQSNRYEYWRVAAREFADHPLIGGGASSFRVAWLRHRTINESVRDAHSLYLETAAELGLVGLAALAVFIAGIVGLARHAPKASAAALVVYAVHGGLDWDWEMPALTLVALLLAAAAAPRAASSRSPQAPSRPARARSRARTDAPSAPI